ncbi:MAG TPA: VOC family protein [Acidimicrobiales bacterium]|nr:VOC family protein [Acidimicrobiales bacterium]
MQAVPEGGQSTVPGVEVQLSVRHGRQAVAFYEAAFGAETCFRLGGSDELEEVVAQLQVGSTRFWVEDESPEHANFSPETLEGATARLLLVVGDPAAMLERAVASGARQVYPVSERHGWLLGRVVDPFGHHWEIGRPLGPWPPAAREERR